MFGILYRRSIPSSARYFHRSAVLGIKDYYVILSVPRNATPQQIKSAYYEKAKLHHPDASSETDGSLKFQEIAEAYEILSDTTKRRAYDSTTRPAFQDLNQDRGFSNGYDRQSRSDPISMNHIRYVYQTLNKEDEPAARQAYNEYTWPGTQYNRFEYTRRWNPEVKDWDYIKRQSSSEYKNKANQGAKIVKLCIVIIILGSIIHLINYKYFLKKMSDQSLRSSDDISKDRAGMYVIRSRDR